MTRSTPPPAPAMNPMAEAARTQRGSARNWARSSSGSCEGSVPKCTTSPRHPKAMTASETIAAIMYQRASGCGVKRLSIVPPLPPGRRLFRDRKPLLPLRPLGERNRVQYRGALVAKNSECPANGTGGFVVAVAARRIEIDACARNERNRPFHRPDDLSEGNIFG